MAEFLGESLTALVARRVACPEWPDCDDDEGRCLACAQAAAIIAALEDRNRLRAALQGVIHRRFVRGFEADAAWARAHAALGGRDG